LLVLGEASYRVLKQPYGEAHMERNWGLLPSSRTNFAAIWVSYLGHNLKL
jgi:hypothetical protein